MFNEMKQNLKKYPNIFKIAKFILELKYYLYDYIFLMRIIFPINRILRINGFIKKYDSLKYFKNKHLNDRCFIIATGPSLNIEDLKKLKNEITFSMNSIVLSYEKTDWRPTYYTLFDSSVYIKLKNIIENSNMNNIFFGDNIHKFVKKIDKSRYHLFPLYKFNHENNIPKDRYYTKFSDDIFDVVYDSGTIMYCTLQIAVYMGFKEIYLLGADVNYYGNKTHFIEYNNIENKDKEREAIVTNRQNRIMVGYKVAKEYADKNNINIYNATRGGMLELFERIDFDKINYR